MDNIENIVTSAMKGNSLVEGINNAVRSKNMKALAGLKINI